MVDIFATPFAQDVGQFGADNSNVERYKQAAEYAADAEAAAARAITGIDEIEDLQEITQQLQNTTNSQAQTIANLTGQFGDLNTQLGQALSDTQSAGQAANQAAQNAEDAIQDVEGLVDKFGRLVVTTEKVPATENADAEFDFAPDPPTLHFKIPKGESGTISDIANTQVKDPVATDYIMIADKTTNTPYIAELNKLSDVVSVRSVNGKTGPVVLNKTDIGLGNVENVASYSKTESDAHLGGFYKAYATKADADADLPNRKEGDVVMVYNYDESLGDTEAPNPSRRDWYKVTSGALVDYGSGERIIRSVNNSFPSPDGNVTLNINSGNPSLWLGEMVMFPYDPDPTKQIDYPGVLRADGGQHSITGNAELLDAFKNKHLPYVDFATWHAGAKTVFAWDGSDTGDFICPDWTGGEALRTPSINNAGASGETSNETKGTIYDQKPFITSVNGKTPDDDQGIVFVTAEDVGALSGTSYSYLPEGASLSAWDFISVNGFHSLPVTYADCPVVLDGQDLGGILINFASLYSGGSSVVQHLYATNAGTYYIRVGALDIDAKTVVWKVNASTDTKGWYVLSVAGYAKAGANNDITELNAVTKPLTRTQGGLGRSWSTTDAASTSAIRTDLGLGSAATKNTPASGDAGANEVVLGNDSRFPVKSITNRPNGFAAGDDARFVNFIPENGPIGQGHPEDGSRIGKSILRGDLVVIKHTDSNAVVNTGTITANSYTTPSAMTTDTTPVDTKNHITISSSFTAPAPASNISSIRFDYYNDSFVMAPVADSTQKIASFNMTLNGHQVDFNATGYLTTDMDMSTGTIPDEAFVTKAYVDANSGGGSGGGPTLAQFNELKADVEDTGTGLPSKASNSDLNSATGRISTLESNASNYLTTADAATTYLTSSDAATNYLSVATHGKKLDDIFNDIIARLGVIEARTSWTTAITPPSGNTHPSNPYQPFVITP